MLLRVGHAFCRTSSSMSFQAEKRTVVFKETLRQHLEQDFPNHELVQWFDPLVVAVDADGKVLRVSFPHIFFGQWFLSTIKKDFESRAQALVKDVSIVYEGFFPDSGKRESDFSLRLYSDTSAPAVSLAGITNRRTSEPHDVPEQSGNVSSTLGSNVHALPEFMGTKAWSAATAMEDHHTFESFLVNRKNDFPMAAMREAIDKIENPPYTPLVIYGQSGCGKTHLAGAMARVLQNKKIPVFHGGIEFLEKALSLPGRQDVFLTTQAMILDDVHHVTENIPLQDALSTLIDICKTQHLLLVLTFDVSPTACAGFGHKLRSRLASGLVVELKRPDIDVRRQYVQRRNEKLALNLAKEQVLSIAQRFQDIRDIDGALTRLLAYHSLMIARGSDGKLPSTGISQTDVSTILDRGKIPVPSPALIVSKVARYFSLTPEDITGKNRLRRNTLPRHLAIFLCREMTGLALVLIGQFFSGRDHSSVLYSSKKIQQLQSSNKEINNHVKELRKLCLAGRS